MFETTASSITSEGYRSLVKPKGLISAQVQIKQTDMLISASCDLRKEAYALITECRKELEHYIELNPLFEHSFVPCQRDESAPEIVKSMIDAASSAGVGPMAAVAGAISDYVGQGLMLFSRDIIVENGGDIFLHSSVRRKMLVLAESCIFKGLKIAIGPTQSPMGICTSSGKLGHSFSFGRADAVAILASTAALADAAATAVGNIIHCANDIGSGILKAQEIGVYGVLILAEDRIGAWGQVEIAG
jgi:ApbE superfamily uncharacterized protein (UPF0280 family)